MGPSGRRTPRRTGLRSARRRRTVGRRSRGQLLIRASSAERGWPDRPARFVLWPGAETAAPARDRSSSRPRRTPSSVSGCPSTTVVVVRLPSPLALHEWQRGLEHLGREPGAGFALRPAVGRRSAPAATTSPIATGLVAVQHALRLRDLRVDVVRSRFSGPGRRPQPNRRGRRAPGGSAPGRTRRW